MSHIRRAPALVLPATLLVLFSFSLPSTTKAAPITRTLSVGSTGVEVSTLQNILNQLGLFSGAVTGYFGQLTKEAVLAFQRQNNLAAVGIVGPLTRAALNSIGQSIQNNPPSSGGTILSASTSKPGFAELNAEVQAAARQYTGEQNSGKKSTLSGLITNLLGQRKSALLDAVQNNPRAVLAATLPATARAELPAGSENLLEQDVDFQGTATVLHTDNFASKVEIPLEYYVVSSTSGKRYRLHFAGSHPDFITGAKVRVRGVALENELVVAGESGGSFTVTSSGTVAAAGSQQTIVILVKFNDDPTPSWGAALIASTTFTGSRSVAAFYNENSNGNVLLTGDVVGWYTINYSHPDGSSTCYQSPYGDAADKAAQAAGVNLSNYAHKVYIFYDSHGTICSSGMGGGSGTIGGNPSLAWIFKSDSNKDNIMTLSHELGHNLGVHHASFYDCMTTQIAPYANCQYAEYGDASDIMGGSVIGPAQFNAPHKAAMGWLSGSNVQTVSQSGTYTITPLESNSGVEVLKIAKPDTSDAYYVSYRQWLGFDQHALTRWDGAPIFTDGASLHVWNGSPAVQTKLVDITPGDINNHTDDTLLDGVSFGDPVNGIKITQISHSSTGASVGINFSTPYVDTVAPTAAITSLYGAYADIATLTASAADDVAVTKVEIYKDTKLFKTLTTRPYSVTWDTTTEVDGSVHTLQAKAYDASGNSGLSAIVTGTVDNTPPTSAITDPANGAMVSGTVRIIVYGTDSLAITAIRVLVDGQSVAISSLAPDPTWSYQTSWNSALVSDGTHTIQAVFTDSAGNAGASPIITITTNNKGAADTTAPSTSITSPTSGATVSGSVTVAASASDNVGVTKVELWKDSALFATDNASPYTFSWDTTKDTNASHTLQIKAYDAVGNVGSSATISVTVSNTITPPPPLTPSIGVGSRITVIATAGLNVRNKANQKSGTLLCTQPYGALGTITGGPTKAQGNTWWNVNFDTGCDGWVVRGGLALTTTAQIPITHTLAKGWTGPEVSALQSLLSKLGFFGGEITGYFGSVTAQAVQSFQSANQLSAVGIVGPQTRALLNGMGR